jgi:hypothetical protein
MHWYRVVGGELMCGTDYEYKACYSNVLEPYIGDDYE